MSAPKIRLSLALIVKNEARCLTRCLQSVRARACFETAAGQGCAPAAALLKKLN
jgi:hypothetical protein